MDSSETPRLDIARAVLPKPLLDSLLFIFEQGITYDLGILNSVMLVGGTALSGFYAGHRRSDDLDLFVRSEDYHKAIVKAVSALDKLGAKGSAGLHTNQYYSSTWSLGGHSFTVDVVVDSNLFLAGEAVTVENKLSVASLSTLLQMKAATLVSRASEKDLYDLLWLFSKFPDMTFEEFLSRGKKIDGGLTEEAVLLSLNTAKLRPESCDFSLDQRKTRKSIYQEIEHMQKSLILSLSQSLHKRAASHPLGDIIKRIKAIT